MKQFDDFRSALDKLNNGKSLIAKDKYLKAGESIRECLRITARHHEALHVELAKDARAQLAKCNEALGFAP